MCSLLLSAGLFGVCECWSWICWFTLFVTPIPKISVKQGDSICAGNNKALQVDWAEYMQQQLKGLFVKVSSGWWYRIPSLQQFFLCPGPFPYLFPFCTSSSFQGSTLPPAHGNRRNCDKSQCGIDLLPSKSVEDVIWIKVLAWIWELPVCYMSVPKSGFGNGRALKYLV